jgi:hypothetical protein
MGRITDVLIYRLKNKGFEPVAIPRFIKDVVHTVSVNHQIGLTEMNRRLCLLGWDPIELDDHTLQLIIASNEKDSVLPERMLT